MGMTMIDRGNAKFKRPSNFITKDSWVSRGSVRKSHDTVPKGDEWGGRALNGFW